MPASNQLRPESLTVAKWWADQLRDLARVLKPIEMSLTERSLEDMVATDGFEAAVRQAEVNFSIQLSKSLTPENIATFERLIAEINDQQMDDNPVSFSALQGSFSQYDPHPIIRDALLEAGIHPYRAVKSPLFVSGTCSMVQPGRVEVAHPDGKSFIQLEIITP